MDENTFIGYATKDMIQHEVTVKFQRRINISKYSANYFSVEIPTKPTFIINYFDACLDFNIFIHEYCHFLQWKSNTRIWKDGIKSLDLYCNWLENKVDLCDLKHVRTIQELEIDADRRVVKLIKKHRFDIDIEKYIQESNAYALTFLYVWNNRDFKKFPINYNNEDILNLMPKTHLSKKDLCGDFKNVMQLFELHQ